MNVDYGNKKSQRLSSLVPVLNFQGTILNQGFTERFVREDFRGKLLQRLLGSEERVFQVIQLIVGLLILIISLSVGANAILLATSGG